ncbi:hypothetical protein LTR85_009315 [Meristemomyces frigidus]|nr:hypothetical protein LTR85_009315 [Meristemomyces frigidus]
MAIGANGGGKLTWTAVKKHCTPADIERLACLAVVFLMSDDVDKSKYSAAAEQFGGNIKPDSYKRGLWVITKKIKDAEEKSGSDDAGDGDEGAPKKAKGGRKRKAASEGVDDAEKPQAKKGKGGKRGKKAKSPEAEEDGKGAAGDTPVKSENDSEGADGDILN